MPWGKPQQGGWSHGVEEEPVSRFSQVIRTVLSVMPGGVIRYGKDGPDDDAHAGFWLGVTAERVARFSVGGPTFWVKWTGTELLVRGRLSTMGGSAMEQRLRWVGDDDADIAYLMGTDSWGHILEIGIPRSAGAGDPGRLDLFVDGDLGASVRLRLKTECGAGAAGSGLELVVGTATDVMSVDGAGRMWVKGVVNCADAAAAADAVNRRTGDGRYLMKSAGWSGSFGTDEVATVTVVNGQVVGVG